MKKDYVYDVAGGGGGEREGGRLMLHQNVFDHCAETLWSRKLKLYHF